MQSQAYPLHRENLTPAGCKIQSELGKKASGKRLCVVGFEIMHYIYSALPPGGISIQFQYPFPHPHTTRRSK
jgi:hypothetical protein